MARNVTNLSARFHVVQFLISVADAKAVAARASGIIGGGGFSANDAFEDLRSDLRKRRQILATAFGTHTLVLNKSPVLPRHVVAVTNEFKSQHGPMALEDMRVLWYMVSQVDGVGFYNGGDRSGGSQPRRHVQFVPFTATREICPEEARGATAGAHCGVPLDAAVHHWLAGRSFTAPTGRPDKLDLPFNHAFAWLGSDVLNMLSVDLAAEKLHRLYAKLLLTVSNGLGERMAGGSDDAEAAYETLCAAAADRSSWRPVSHNVILTPRWMLVVPRCQAEAELSEGPGSDPTTLSINALGFTGMMLVKGEQIRHFDHESPLHVLKRVVADAP